MAPHEVAVPIMFAICVATIIIIALVARHRERLTMVEKGMSSEDIKALYSREIRRDPLSSLKWGMLFVFGGIAVLFGNFLVERYDVHPPVILGLVILFVGLALVIFYTFAKKKMKQD